MAVTALTASAQAQKTIRVAAAADLEPVLPPILATFEKQTGVHAEATYQSSATLAQQIENGSDFDIFFAADTSFPQRVITAGLAEETAPVAYARGTLVLWARRDSAVFTGQRGNPKGAITLQLLREPSLRSLAVANPDHAPYGRAAKASLTSLDLLPALTPKLIVAENIAQTAQYADSGNAEAGLISLTSALTPRLQQDGRYMEMPRDSYPAILQGAVILKHAKDPADARRLLDMMLAPATRQMLAAKGLAAPE